MHDDSTVEKDPNPYASPHASSDVQDFVTEQHELPQNVKPFRAIWFHPRQTVRWIVATNPNLHVISLVCLAGIGESLDRASWRNAGDAMPLAAVILVAMISGPAVGLFSLWVSSHLIRLAGNWLGGKGIRENIRAAIGWSSVPAVAALPLWIPQLLLFGSDMFTEETPQLDAQPMLIIPFLFIAFVEFVLGTWGFVLLCHTIAEVQGFRSAWRGLGNLMLAGAIVIVPLLAIAIAIAAVTKG